MPIFEGTPNNDNLTGTNEDDTLIGGDGNDTLDGRNGNDELYGGPGDDLIIQGGSGVQVYDGGDGNDTFFTDTAVFGSFTPQPDFVAQVELNTGFSGAKGGPGNLNDTVVDIENVVTQGDWNWELIGDDGDNLLTSGAGNDVLIGGAGDDTLTGGEGDDTIDGGDGFDIAAVGNAAFVGLVFSPEGLTIVDRAPDGSGTDFLTNVERIMSADGETLDLEQFSSAASLTASDLEMLIELYIAYFNRAPDAVGLNFWGTAFANGTTLEEMATLFIDQDETRDVYPDGTSNTDFVTAVYGNVLGRVPDQAGFDFWVDMLNRSEVTGVTRDQFILEVLRGVSEGSSDREYLDNKIDVGAYFGIHRGMNDTNNASTVMSLYDGSQSSIEDAIAAIDEFYQDILDLNSSDYTWQVVGVLDNPFEV